MSRHSRNCTASAVFTYHERLKVEGVGSKTDRLGSSSLSYFEQCRICLRTAFKPVATPLGVIYCRSCLVTSVGSQKCQYDENKRISDLVEKVHEQNTKRLSSDVLALESAKKKLKLTQGEAVDVKSPSEGTDHISEKFLTRNERKKKYIDTGTQLQSKAFWDSHDLEPSSSTSVDIRKVQNAQSSSSKFVPKCPTTGLPFKLKELIDLKPEVEIVKNECGTEVERWKCSFSGKLISHRKAAVIKDTGLIFLLEVADKMVIGNPNPNSEVKSEIEVYKWEDILELQIGETPFSAHNVVEAKITRSGFF